MYSDFFPKRLSQLRQQQDTSAREMSISLGQNVNYINSIENKKMLPSMSGFFYICDYLNISPKDFFDIEIENPKLISEILDELKRLEDSQLNNILGIARGIK